MTAATQQMTASGSAQDRFFGAPMYALEVQGWPVDEMYPGEPLTDPVSASQNARLRLWAIDPRDGRRLPPPDGVPPLVDTAQFSLVNSGNRTLTAPKRSWKVDLDPGEVAGMSTLNLKSMYNDPSQMREALAWRLFRVAGVPASRHTYARLAINDRFLGLFSLIEQVDKAFLRQRFAGKPHGNLYKVFCGDLGPGTLQRRVAPDGDDSGRQYRGTSDSDHTYRLKSYSDAPDAHSYDDLAWLCRAIDGAGLPGGTDRFDTDAFATGIREVLDVDTFLRWAGVNVLVGAWDNYFATPANYYLYNGGRGGDDVNVVSAPYFAFIPWDYDNTFGIDYFGTSWQYTDVLDWASNTGDYWRRNGHGRRSHLPLVVNLLQNTAFRRYYLDHLEHLLDTEFNPAAIDARIGATNLWSRVVPGAYLESDTPDGVPFTGRQFTNDEVYRSGFEQLELRHRDAFVLGVHHYVRMRYDSARRQLDVLRRRDPAGSSGANFAAVPAP
jgi:CotH protein